MNNNPFQSKKNTQTRKALLNKESHTAVTSPIKLNKKAMNSYKGQQSLYERYQKENLEGIKNIINMKEKHSLYSNKPYMEHIKQENNKSTSSYNDNDQPFHKSKPKNSYSLLNEYNKCVSPSASHRLNKTTTIVYEEAKTMKKSSSICFNPINEINYNKKHAENTITNKTNNIVKQKGYYDISNNDFSIITHNSHCLNKSLRNSSNNNPMIIKQHYYSKKLEKKKSMPCPKEIPKAEIDLFTDSLVDIKTEVK